MRVRWTSESLTQRWLVFNGDSTTPKEHSVLSTDLDIWKPELLRKSVGTRTKTKEMSKYPGAATFQANMAAAL